MKNRTFVAWGFDNGDYIQAFNRKNSAVKARKECWSDLYKAKELDKFIPIKQYLFYGDEYVYVPCRVINK